MADSQRAREAPGVTGSGQTEPLREIRPGLFCFLVVALGLTSLEATAQTVTGLTTTPGGFSSFQTPFLTPLSPATPVSPPGQAWPTVQSAVPALWTPRGAVGAPGPSTTPHFLVTGAIDVAEGYATNPGQQSSTNAANAANAANPSAFTRGQVDLGLHYDSLRLKVDAHSSTNGFYYYTDHDANQFNQYLNLVGNTELIPSRLFFNFNANAAPVALTRVGQLSSTPGFAPSSNNQQSYGYFANPVYRTHFGDYVTSETSFSYSQLIFQQPSTVSTGPTVPVVPLQNTTSSTITQGFSSGPSSGRLKWNVTGSYSNMDQTGGGSGFAGLPQSLPQSQPQSQQETLGILSASYAINRVFSLLGTGGYDQITSSTPLTRDLAPLVALGGVRFTLGPKFTLAAAAGTSHGFPTYLGSLNWDVTARSTIVGSLTESVSTAQGNILNNLSTLAVSSAGVFSDTQSYYWQTLQQALYPQFATVSPVPIGGLTLSNGLSRTQTANISFIHTDDRNTYTLSLFGQLQTQLSVPALIGQSNCLISQPSSFTQSNCANSALAGARLSASRNLRRDLTGFVAVSYSLSNEFGGNDRSFEVDAGLNYLLSPKTSAYVSAQYLQTQSIGQSFFGGVPQQATVMVGIRYRLGS